MSVLKVLLFEKLRALSSKFNSMDVLRSTFDIEPIYDRVDPVLTPMGDGLIDQAPTQMAACIATLGAIYWLKVLPHEKLDNHVNR